MGRAVSAPPSAPDSYRRARFFTRVTAIVLGVADTDSVYNVYARVLKIGGVDHFDFDMTTGTLTMDFRPDFTLPPTVTAERLDNELERSGYQVEDVKIAVLRYTDDERRHRRSVQNQMPRPGDR